MVLFDCNDQQKKSNQHQSSFWNALYSLCKDKTRGNNHLFHNNTIGYIKAKRRVVELRAKIKELEEKKAEEKAIKFNDSDIPEQLKEYNLINYIALLNASSFFWRIHIYQKNKKKDNRLIENPF